MKDISEVIDTTALTGWLNENAPGLGDGPLQLDLVSGGSTNLILSLSRGGASVIFRSPPPEGSPQGAKTIHREATVVRALADTDVPSPGFVGYCPDPDVVGLPFYLMEQVDGWAANIDQENRTTYPPQFSSGPDLHYLPHAMNEGLIAMANVDYQAIGLERFGKPEGFLDRQADRWLGQVAGYEVRYPKYTKRDLDGLEYVADWLRANVPPGAPAGLMHGDFAPNNALFAHRPPTRLVAIIDWETATIGDPLLDLAAFALHLPSGTGAEDGDGVASGYFGPGSFPLRSDVIAYYAEKTGRDVSHIDYYYVLCRFRTACMIEYKVAESIQGLSPKAKGDRFDALVRGLLSEAQDLARSLG